MTRSSQVQSTDVIIIGSGFGAAPPALRMAEAGYRVIVLEKGEPVDPARDFRETQEPDYLLKYYKQVDGDGIAVTRVEGLGGGSSMYLAISQRIPSLVFHQKDPDHRPLLACRHSPRGSRSLLRDR